MKETITIITTATVESDTTNWKTAKEMNEIANNVHNAVLYELVNNLMEMIKEAAEKGNIKLQACVKGGRCQNVYENAQHILRLLGYEVCGQVTEGNVRYWAISWE